MAGCMKVIASLVKSLFKDVRQLEEWDELLKDTCVARSLMDALLDS